MKKLLFAVIAVSALLATACGDRHFLTDKAYRDKVHEDFMARRQLAQGREAELFAVLDDEGLSAERREALEFFYAYMPLCDLAEYDGEYFLSLIDGAFRARDYFPWGKSVPEDIFRHFVLVYRVNNEYMDDARDLFFEELKGRIEGMSMYDAVLEVNHWCHEKVTYRATDARTSAPVALARTSWGRCGEESTFTVAALRAVGIPARQCYTPRWVHTDSNHAWVEVWVDGKWYYMGACEPEPELNVAWFDGPVQRAMMTNTTVYGLYNGPEDKNVETPLYSVINTLDNYARTRKLEVRVVDETGNPVEGARVKYQVYNYAQLSTIVTLASDAEGKSSLTTGFGDIMVRADRDGAYGYVKSGPEDNQITITLDRRAGEAYEEEFIMNAPAEQPFNELPEEKIAENAARLAAEDAIRNAYMATFPDRDYTDRLADALGLARDRVWYYINTAQGNWRDIERLITENAKNPVLDDFIMSLREKDLRDTPADYLSAHLNAELPAGADDPQTPTGARYVLSPRIEYELITPWRAELYEDVFAGNPAMRDPEAVIAYVRERITVMSGQNFYNCRLTPLGVHSLRISDAPSRDIYFVALCRTGGIPARLEPATGKPQYFDAEWHDVAFENDTAAARITPKGTVTFTYDPANPITPAYETHFTLAVFRDGDFQTLKLGDLFDNAGAGRPVTMEFDEGYYRLMVASRANDGSATVKAEYFTLGEGGNLRFAVKLPEVEGKLFVKGVVDMNSIVITEAGEKTTLKGLAKGKGVLLIFADPDKEPTKHILQEMPRHTKALEEWGGGVVFMVPDDKRTEAFDPARFGGLPAQTVWSTDTGRELLAAAAQAIQVDFRNNFPLALYLTRNGGVIFSSEGYRLGIIEDVLRTIHMEEQSLQ